MLRTMEPIVIESTIFTKAIIALFPASMLFCGAAVQYFRGRSTWSLLQLLGAGCLVVVVIAHIFEALQAIRWMQWGIEHSIGHYLDLTSAILAFTLFPADTCFKRWQSNARV